MFSIPADNTVRSRLVTDIERKVSLGHHAIRHGTVFPEMNESALGRSSRANLTVSVVIISYNGARYIGDQVQSIIRQTRTPEEIIISDDASNDDTVERARSTLGSWHGQSHVRTARRNVGASANLQAGLGEATGDVIMLADQDDIWWPQRVERQMAAIENDPSVAAVFCDADLVDAEGHSVGALTVGA